MKTRRKNRLIPTSPTYAIVHLLFKSETYLIGACIAGYVHQQFRKKYDLQFDIILMVDATLYRYKKELEQFYDQVRLIDILPLTLSDSYSKVVTKRYADVMSLFTTKLNVFQLHEYTKVLFMDIDMLPVHKDFYNVFTYETPAFQFTHASSKIKYAPSYTKSLIYSKVGRDLSIQSKYMNTQIGAGLFLISPTKGEFEEIVKFMHTCEGHHGYTSYQTPSGRYSGPDETILLHYFALQKNIPIISIAPEYRQVPWYSLLHADRVYCFDYMSDIKPFNTPLFMMHREAFIYYFLVRHVIKSSAILKRIHYRNLATIIIDYDLHFFENHINKRCSYSPKLHAAEIISNVKSASSLTPFLINHNSYEAYASMDKDVETMLETSYNRLNDPSKLDMSHYGMNDKPIKEFYKFLESWS